MVWNCDQLSKNKKNNQENPYDVFYQWKYRIKAFPTSSINPFDDDEKDKTKDYLLFLLKKQQKLLIMNQIPNHGYSLIKPFHLFQMLMLSIKFLATLEN